MSNSITALWHRHGRVARLTLLSFAFLPILANCVVALIALNDLREANVRVARTLQAMMLLKQVENLVETSGKDQRLYRLYGDAEKLQEYREAQSRLTTSLQKLTELGAAGAIDSAQLSRFRLQVEEDGAALAQSLTPLEIPTGSVPMDLAVGIGRTGAIEDAVDNLLHGEKIFVDKRVSSIASGAFITFVTVVLGGIASAVLVGVIFAFMHRELRRSEELAATRSGALEESEQRFRRIFEASPVGIVLAEADGLRIVQASPAFCRMVGYEAEDVLGRDLFDIIHVDDRELLSASLEQERPVDHGGNSIADGTEIRYVTRSGAIAWARMRTARLSGPEGQRPLLLLLVGDVTHEKRVEAELRQAQKMEAIGQLSGGIAHDFNNLLGVIIGNVEFLIDELNDAPQGAMAKEILDSALSGADLTRRLLAFARRQALQPSWIDLNAYLPNHVAILRRLLGESISVTMTLADHLWPVRADPSQVGDALLNLAINARDAMPHGGLLSIATANAHLAVGEQDDEVTEGDYVVLSVSDTGIGMPPELLERVVEPFFTTKEPGEGSGLGLSMIFGFAKQSGGHLRIESEPGHGTTVRLYLPRARDVEPRDAEEAADVSLPEGSESILLVDDNADMRAVARRQLVSLGYRVSEAGNGTAALQALRHGGGFDLLFTDVVMPDGMTGYQLAAAARQLLPRLKVLFTTGYSRSDPGDEPAGTVIRKPYRRPELAAAVRAALEVSG
jgi:PAS domain S-box-containing protein